MFAWKDKRGIQETISKLVSAENNGRGANRRAINLVPLPAVRDAHEIAQSHRIKYHQLLVSIEAKQSTCCIRIVSETSKSRAAILVFRGRVLGCLYGSKFETEQVFGQEAHRLSMSELAKPGNIIDTYLLNEELVLAGGALFHGHPIEHSGGTAEQIFETVVRNLMHSNSPGCVVINSSTNEALCMVYIFKGQIAGVYSFSEGWVQSTYETALGYVLSDNGVQVMASALAARNIKEVEEMTFSLTGLGDRASHVSYTTFIPTDHLDVEELQKDSGRHKPLRNNSGLIRSKTTMHC
ncbi:MAG: hypothetical protein U0103_10005 [Candidatus Obscuribacterales bacterium]|nr:hypothetical protein [Cyanobacteria bacterium SZAS LIN-5]